MTNSRKSQSEKLATGGGRETTAVKPGNRGAARFTKRRDAPRFTKRSAAPGRTPWRRGPRSPALPLHGIDPVPVEFAPLPPANGPSGHYHEMAQVVTITGDSQPRNSHSFKELKGMK